MTALDPSDSSPPAERTPPEGPRTAQPPTDSPPTLTRSLGLSQAIALNVANMVGVGPFITIPLFVKSMGGPHALVAWVIAAVLVLCDGLVWSELGAALPGSGGSYHFLKETYGRLHPVWGRLMPFLFIWQFLLSGTLETASGYIGAMQYVRYIFPKLDGAFVAGGLHNGMNLLAAAACLVVTALLCRHIRVLGWLSILLVVGTFAALLMVIFAGLPHVDPQLLTFPPGAFRWENSRTLAYGLGAAMTIAVYDYLGYYNICFLGDEVKNPARTIPRAVIGSIVIVAFLYLSMNLTVLGVIPWQEVVQSTNIGADLMERLYGRPAAKVFAWLVIWTALAGVFAMTLGYSRIPFAAARRGDFFAVFGKLHPRGNYPVVSIITLGSLTAICCFFSLETVIQAAVAVRILVQFIGQIVGLHLMRTSRRGVPLPFRMWLYPLPSLIAVFGWLFLLGTSDWNVLKTALAVTAAGVPVFFIWQTIASRRGSASA